MLKDLNNDQLLLEELMSQISEVGFAARWMKGLEFDLWGILNGENRKYGVHTITQDELDQLRSLSNKCGCWIVFDDEKEETAVDLEIWKKLFLNNKSIY
jgi:hypothetical protein